MYDGGGRRGQETVLCGFFKPSLVAHAHRSPALPYA
jgi:hypothetical protein